MAVLIIPAENRRITQEAEIAAYLQAIGLGYERWVSSAEAPAHATAEEILDAYANDIARLKQERGYVAADVIDVYPDTPGLDAMLAKFDKEHTHDDDEVRFTVEGEGIFSINPVTGPVVHIHVFPGDLLVVPKDTLHWFHLGASRRIRAIRLFADAAGWSPNYTQSGLETRYPVTALAS
jgi:1,2-dihydroxy-3-keto-5-methylthiopentene dioxygenase